MEITSAFCFVIKILLLGLGYDGSNMVMASDQLMFVQTVWRHGDRAPEQTYPTDKHQENAWPNGFGELTEIGMRQQYSLGRLIRERYIDSVQHPLLSPTYEAEEIYVRSTDVNRTLVSAMANLAGMYPNGIVGEDYPNSAKGDWPAHWTPIPVHTVKYETDHIGNAFAKCERASQLGKQIRSSKLFQKYATDNEKFFEFLTKKTGMHVGLENVFRIHDVHIIEKQYNLSQPDWLTDKVAAKILNLTEVSYKSVYGLLEPRVPEMIKLRGGSLLKAIVEKMNEKIRCAAADHQADPSCDWMRPLKYYAYSAHDTTVSALLATLGNEEEVLKGKMPKYTASVAIELWMTDTGPAVKILFRCAYRLKFHPITSLTPGCPTDSDFCPLSRFEKRSKEFMPVDIVAECKPKS